MGLTTVQRTSLQNDDLQSVEDFEDLKEDKIKMAVNTLRQGIPTIPGTPTIPEQRNSQGCCYTSNPGNSTHSYS